MKKILSVIFAVTLMLHLATAIACCNHCPRYQDGCKMHRPQQMQDRMNYFFSEAGVTGTQKQKIDSIMQESRNKELEIHNQIRDKKQALMDYMLSPCSTKDKAIAQSKEINNLKNELSVLRINSMFEVKQVLTKEQQQKMMELHQRRMDKFDNNCPMTRGCPLAK